ncbi:CDP-alcohol phosphatidyltransferase family protein [Pacificimonas flava]|uniref:CDP-alcohol phosphatidyltransferase n=1 Tax=Pacificimonas flava TaxID=1234595 RepID=M2TKR3_9SPHN|nr:CDP-alcohol phosphatidyltransferase family protein [Pacificimonas flava]EMD82256.1 CDP-alcohol phosphatidyltransferase [Pacificimonas flava]MBB5280835.1 phosphatidylglycerophosphate synthase [Pacificimonas flava]
MTNETNAAPTVAAFGTNDTPIWGMSAEERLRRIAKSRGHAYDPAAASGPLLLSNLVYVFDPAWMAHLETRPGTVMTRRGVPVLAHVEAGDRTAVEAAAKGAPLPAHLTVVAAEAEGGILNEALRKREKPFAEQLTPANVAAIERLSYLGAYKGVTDLLTKYLWPKWAFALTKLSAKIGLSPNGVTAIGSVLCIAATIAFWYGWFWTGLAAGLVFMVLDTVDGKLARCTITSSKLGNAWDHGVDLVHPPFWWWAWAEGCAAYGRPLSDTVFWWVIGAMLFGYVAQRLIEGAFILRFDMHIHVWERFDSWFRLITARRNPNMVILFALLLVGRPDWGIVAVAIWTMISLLVHLWRLFQAMARRSRGQAIESWLA